MAKLSGTYHTFQRPNSSSARRSQSDQDQTSSARSSSNFETEDDYIHEQDEEVEEHSHTHPQPSLLLPNYDRTSLPQSSATATCSETEDPPAPRTPAKQQQQQQSVRESYLSPSRSHRSPLHRGGIPRHIARPARIRSSPRPRTKERQEEQDRLALPLVLLHVTLLPVQLPWSATVMEEEGTLTEEVRERIRVLKDRLGPALLQRGLLIGHPEDDIGLLEERVVRVLGLKKDGEKERRWSSEGSDSAIGLSECDDDDRARKYDRTAAIDAKWDVKVFAANGLMRADTWASAWNEMERVDVEILPFIPEDVRKRLNARHERLKAAEQRKNEEERLEKIERREDALERAEKAQSRRERDFEKRLKLEQQVRALKTPSEHHHAKRPKPKTAMAEHDMNRKRESLPQAYRSNEVPLDVLLRNYFYLWMQDTRNIIIVLMSIVIVVLTLNTFRPALSAQRETQDIVVSRVNAGNLTVGTLTPVIDAEPVKHRRVDDTDQPLPSAQNETDHRDISTTTDQLIDMWTYDSMDELDAS